MRSLSAGVGTGLGLVLLIGPTVGHSAEAPRRPGFPSDSSAESPPTVLDWTSYGGVKDMTLSEASRTFRRAKIGDRWIPVTPEGHPFWMMGVYNIGISGRRDDRGGAYRNRVIVKYGDASVRYGATAGPRLRSWGFNTIAEYANKWVLPWTTYGGQAIAHFRADAIMAPSRTGGGSPNGS